MRVYGNLTNRIEERGPSAECKVGEGVTMYAYSDRYAGTITEVIPQASGDQVICVQEDHAERADNNGMCETQVYRYSPNPKGRMFWFKTSKHGWREVTFNEMTKRYNVRDGGLTARVGERDKYHDYGF